MSRADFFGTSIEGPEMNDSTLAIEPLLAQVASADTLDALESVRVALLGKSGAVTEQLKMLGRLPPEQRKAQGERINVVKERLQDAIGTRRSVLEEAAFAA